MLLVVTIVILAAMAALILYASRRNKRFAQRLAGYAASKGWSTGGQSPLVPAMQRQRYHSAISMMSGMLAGQGFWLYECAPPTMQAGQYSEDRPVTMLSVKLPLSFPDLLLVPSAGPLNMALDEVAKRTYGLQPLRLEGDFNKHFRLYTQDGTQVETLEIFTPDVMADLESKLHDAVLFSGDYLSICANVMQDIKSLESMIDAANLLVAEIQKKAQFARDRL